MPPIIPQGLGKTRPRRV